MRIHQVDRFWLKNLSAITVGVIFDNIKSHMATRIKKIVESNMTAIFYFVYSEPLLK